MASNLTPFVLRSFLRVIINWVIINFVIEEGFGGNSYRSNESQ